MKEESYKYILEQLKLEFLLLVHESRFDDAEKVFQRYKVILKKERENQIKEVQSG